MEEKKKKDAAIAAEKLRKESEAREAKAREAQLKAEAEQLAAQKEKE